MPQLRNQAQRRPRGGPIAIAISPPPFSSAWSSEQTFWKIAQWNNSSNTTLRAMNPKPSAGWSLNHKSSLRSEVLSQRSSILAIGQCTYSKLGADENHKCLVAIMLEHVPYGLLMLWNERELPTGSPCRRVLHVNPCVVIHSVYTTGESGRRVRAVNSPRPVMRESAAPSKK